MRLVAVSVEVLLGMSHCTYADAQASSSISMAGGRDESNQSKQTTSGADAADESSSTRHTSESMAAELRLGFVGSPIGQAYLWIDGRRIERTASEYIGLQLAYAHRIGREWGMVALTRVGRLETAWGSRRGEWLARLDFALGPEWRIGNFYLALPVGYSWLHGYPGDYRIVRQDYQGGHGLVAAGVLGVSRHWGHHGFSVEASYGVSCNWLTYTATVVHGPATRERHVMILHQAQGAMFYSYRF